MTILIGIVDDHHSFRTSMSMLINSFPGMSVVLQAQDGQDLLDKLLVAEVVPAICLIDVNMPILNGPATASKMAIAHPGIKSLAMSMEEEDSRLISMLRSGCRGWWPKHFTPEALERAILEVHETGYYNADPLNIAFRYGPDYVYAAGAELSVRERQLLELCCTLYTEEEIRIILGISDVFLHELIYSVYAKLHVRSRLGAVLEAIRRGIV
jgi:DNA-binding NarL/FixJ family response regulator